MDVVDDLLRRVRVVGAGFRRLEFGDSLEIDLSDATAVAIVMPTGSEVEIHGQNAEPLLLLAGSTAVLTGGGSVRLTSPPRSARSDDCADRASVIIGTCRVQGEAARRLISMLPAPLILPADDECEPIHRSIATSEVVRNRLLEWILVCTLRAWFDGSAHRLSTETLSLGHRAIADARIGPVLHAIHRAPHHPWTVNSLARVSGLSRTAFTERFSRLLGTPPLAYLTRWRMSVAAELMAETAEPVSSVAGMIGYADAFGFSTAFKRAHGMSPTDYRECSDTAECLSGAC